MKNILSDVAGKGQGKGTYLWNVLVRDTTCRAIVEISDLGKVNAWTHGNE